MKPVIFAHAVRVVNDSPVSNKAVLTIGDTIIPFYEVNINITAGELVTVVAKVRAEAVDVVALQRDTEVVITDGRES